MNSLRGRLLLFLFTLAGIAVAAIAFISYRSVLQDTDEIFDYQLQQMALSLRDQGAVPDDHRAALADPSLDYVVQVWTSDGSVTYSSHPNRRLPPTVAIGFANAEIDGRPWRIYSTLARDRVIRVAQPLAVRKALAASTARRSVVPVLVAAPIVALAMWWLVGVSLAPLGTLVASVRAREAESLNTLDAAGLPSEITPLVDALNGLLARLGAALQAQRAFVADAAHELRSPLTALKLQLDLVRLAPDEGARDDALRDLSAGMDRVHHLLEQLLALARAEPGGPDAVVGDADLAEVARQAAADTVALASARGTDLELDAARPVAVRGDRAALRMLARNLIDNAVRYAGAARAACARRCSRTRARPCCGSTIPARAFRPRNVGACSTASTVVTAVRPPAAGSASRSCARSPTATARASTLATPRLEGCGSRCGLRWRTRSAGPAFRRRRPNVRLTGR